MLFFLLLSFFTRNAAQTFDVRSFGAINDGLVHNNTHAFAAAVSAASAWFTSSGGEQGVVLVTGGGEYLSGRIELKSGVVLNVDIDTILKASSNVSD